MRLYFVLVFVLGLHVLVLVLALAPLVLVLVLDDILVVLATRLVNWIFCQKNENIANEFTNTRQLKMV